MVTGRAVLFSASLLCADDNQKESSDPLHCSVKTSLLSSSSFWWSPPRPDQLLLLCSCWLISGTTKTCEDVILCAALQGTVSKQLMMAPLSLADRSDRSIICPDHGQEWRWSTLECGEQVDNYEEDNFIIAYTISVMENWYFSPDDQFSLFFPDDSHEISSLLLRPHVCQMEEDEQ